MASSSPRPMAWDPKSPAALMLPTFDPETNDLRVDKFLSDDGVGCNSYERSAMMKLITAQAEYYKSGDDNVKALSRAFQRALIECMEGWEGDESLNDESSLNNLELLKMVYAVTQLSDVYLLMPSSDDRLDGEDPWSVPGAVTADTVRYLRYNYMGDPFEVVGEVLDDMLESLQPEQYGTPFWKLLQTLVLRGCLDDAWSLISRHSLCRRCEKTEILDEYHAITIDQDREGFRVLQSLLLSAPLPGGRSEWRDSGLALDDSTHGEEDSTLLLDGVPRDAYKLWDSTSFSYGEIGPLKFNPYAANSTLKVWKRAVMDNASLNGLVRRVPQLQTNVIDILIGKFDVVVFESWSEALCAELLYQRPNLCPKDMHVRAESVMKKLGAPVNAGFDKIVLSIMEGDAGCALETLCELGGSSGAALPATMTSLLCNLLTEAEQIPRPDPSSFSFQTELLLSASEALLSSLSSSEPDLGARLSTGLLLPFAKPSGDARITATLGETLERHGPSTDAEARVLLDLCRVLVARKSRRVLDGCVKLILFRYQHYLSDQRYGGAVHWLLKGIELEALFFATTGGRREEKAWEIVNASGVFGPLLCSSCLAVSKSLLVDLVEETQDTHAGLDFARAREMVASIQEDDPSGLAHNISEVKLLVLVFGMARAIVEEEGDPAIAKNIVACLEENANEDDVGVVAPLAHYSMYWELLSLAYTILKRDEGREESSAAEGQCTASFGVQGIRLLMSKFVELTKGSAQGPLTPDITSFRLALGKGLARAIVVENAKRQEFGLPKNHGQLGSARSSKLSSYSQSEQEKIVQLMLGPSM